MNHRILVLAIFVLSFLISCGDDNPANSSKTPQISTIIQDSAKAGEIITISGINFGIVQDTSYITFNNVRVINITSWADRVIKLRVPVGVTSGKVSVTVNSIKSNELNFTVIEPDLFESVTIGSQIWMKRNLDVSTYRNGEIILHAENIEDWIDAGNKKEGAWCYYNNYLANGTIYGKLYNWYAVNDPRGLAPSGWRLPYDEEWTLLTEYLGGTEVAGGKMKETGMNHWESPNTGASNSCGFTALPGGLRDLDGGFGYIGKNSVWWSVTESSNAATAWYTFLYHYNTNVNRNAYSKISGFSVRCVKD